MSHCWRKTSSPEITNSLSAKGTGRTPDFILFIMSTYTCSLNCNVRNTIVFCHDRLSCHAWGPFPLKTVQLPSLLAINLVRLYNSIFCMLFHATQMLYLKKIFLNLLLFHFVHQCFCLVASVAPHCNESLFALILF